MIPYHPERNYQVTANFPTGHGVCGIFDESHRYETKSSVGWQIAMNAKIAFKLPVTATPGFHSLFDRCFQTMWLFPGAPEDPEDDTVI